MGDVEMRRLLRRAALEKTQHPVRSQPLRREVRPARAADNPLHGRESNPGQP
jgi:hypothetical protein